MKNIYLAGICLFLFGCTKSIDKNYIGYQGPSVKQYTVHECADMYDYALYRAYCSNPNDPRLEGSTCDMVNAIYDGMDLVRKKFNKFYTNFDKFLGKSKEDYVVKFRNELQKYINAWKDIMECSDYFVYISDGGGSLAAISEASIYSRMYFKFIYNILCLLNRYRDEYKPGSFVLREPFSLNRYIEYKNFQKETKDLFEILNKKCK